MTANLGLRTSTLPVEYLEAEVLAAPFASPSAFLHALTKLAPGMTVGTRDLWRHTELDLLGRFPGLSIDDLVIRRDKAWFPDPTRSNDVSLGAVLEAGAGTLVAKRSSQEGDDVAARESDGRRRWRWFTFALPADLLLAAAGMSEDRRLLSSPPLAMRLADLGVAEMHLHMKAALSFPDLWGSLMRELAHPRAKATMLESPGAQFDEGRQLTRWLLRSAAARLLLAAFLRNPRWRGEGLRTYLEARALPALATICGAIGDRHLRCVLEELAVGKFHADSPEFATLRTLYAQLVGAQPAATQDAGSVAAMDPLSWWFEPTAAAAAEFRFVTAALEYLREAAGGDEPFARLFWQIVRLRVAFYRHVVQRPLVPGLQWFARTYARLSPPRKPVPNGHYVSRAADLSGMGVKSLELRVVPEATLPELLQVVLDVDEAAGKWESNLGRSLEVGLVFHFSRSRGRNAESGAPHAWGRQGWDDPAAQDLNPSGYRYSRYFVERCNEASSLASLLLTFPRMLERVRGLDLCTDELGVPLWVMCPLIEHVRRAGRRAASTLTALEGRSPPPLRLTVHCGEDFIHLLGGIRRVDEAIEFLRIGEGDRIGHAVSLGIDVNAWTQRSRRLLVPRGERLLDLLWCWRVAVRLATGSLREWIPWLEPKIGRLAREMFRPSSPTLHELDAWVRRLHSVDGLKAAGFPTGPTPSQAHPEDPDRLVLRWLTDHTVFQLAQEPESVDVDREVGLVEALQLHVRGELAARGIAVEINPSSNLLIGHLGDLRHHPLWRMSPPSTSAAMRPRSACASGPTIRSLSRPAFPTNTSSLRTP